MKIFFLSTFLVALILSRKDPYQTQVTNLVVLNIKIGNDSPKKVIIGLFGNDVPYTVENFYRLCVQKNLQRNGKKMSYINSKFHRVIKDFMIQGGDFTAGNGTGGVSIWGTKFNDENFNIGHEKGVVAMANSGPNTNGSQFFITTVKTDWLEGKHVVFGVVVHGMKTVLDVANLDNGQGKPTQPVTIVDCYDPTTTDL
jgi:cyclophilin family peptidyl-prolyl cis-trans isomerase